jgi:hypothetical protein
MSVAKNNQIQPNTGIFQFQPKFGQEQPFFAAKKTGRFSPDCSRFLNPDPGP